MTFERQYHIWIYWIIINHTNEIHDDDDDDVDDDKDD
jgi:hypothetical protein